MQNVSVENILDLSSSQGCTCMYSKKELKTFPQEKLNAIYEGITALSKRGPWRRERRNTCRAYLKRLAAFNSANRGA